MLGPSLHNRRLARRPPRAHNASSDIEEDFYVLVQHVVTSEYRGRDPEPPRPLQRRLDDGNALLAALVSVGHRRGPALHVIQMML